MGLTKINLWIFIGLFFQASFAYSQDQCAYIDQVLYPNEYRACLRMQIASSANIDCVSCLFAEEEKSNPWVEALGIVAAPLAMFGSAAITSYYDYKGQKKWANAYKEGHKQCTNRFNSYVDYSIERGAAPILPEQATDLNNSCNGSSLGGYAGFGGGIGGGGIGLIGNPYIGGGFSP
ncbi:MAG: hypothetical protein DRQ89_05555, partial [Epsilonproteobacteria bacterium]